MVTKLPNVLLTKAITFGEPSDAKYLSTIEADAAFAWCLENCVITGARPAQPVFWIRLQRGN